MDWGSVLFGILKKMVSPGTKQAKCFVIQISLLLESVPNLELGASLEFPSSKILTDNTIHRYISVIDKSGAQEPADAPKFKKAPKTKVASRKRPADIPLDVPVVKKKRTSKKKSTLKLVAVAQEAIPIQIVPAESAVEPMVEDQQAETEDVVNRPAAEEETPVDRPAEEIASVEQRLDFSTEGQDVAKGDRVGTWFDRALAEEIATASDDSPTEKVNDEEIPWFVRPFLSADHDNERLFETGSDSVDTMDFEVHSQTLPVVRNTNVDPAADIPLPSASIEITKIMGTKIQIPGVDEKLCYLDSLPKITADDKGKELLFEKDPVKGHPAREHYFSICANIDFLVKLREQIIEEVDRFFHSFSFKKLESINVEEMSQKEDLVLSWGETESIHEALSRKRTCCSAIFEGSPHDRGAVIARTNTNTPSKCWIRTMIYVNGVWTVEPCADRWVKIPQQGEGVSSRVPQPTRARVPVRVERHPLPTREPSPDAQK
ncbi:eukaryotic translation initiation factor isoform 4G-1 [Dorcoceras hygrometricum]|uniref:Eukaryotic translation initiation factor isoform 4G-1 n=1 Tax=Dorcoceras hygrometricum TaxID=472368 RepID=A0A2Z7AFJ8_9LAMI|nr:eukaryotic translation initiation factor isoform 4G-1 [Dorcoceras hygrometricum]